MFRNKKIQNAMNRQPSSSRRSALTTTVVVGLATTLIVSLAILLCGWGLALMSSLQQQRQQQQYQHQQQAVTTRKTGRHTGPAPGRGNSETATIQKKRQILQDFRTKFHERYGGAAGPILQRGIQRYGDILVTAERMVQASIRQEAFRLSFAGYSVTVGRGNRLEESYPLVLQQLLDPLVRATLGIPVAVTNAAIGGIPSFPYGFCFAHFLGPDADVISWDYSMNEGNGAAVLEAYLRQSQVQLTRRPMVIVLDTNTKRCNLVKSYADHRWIADGLCVGMAKHAVPDLIHYTEGMSNSDRPVGFRDWDQFGAPPNCPGRGNWHPKRKEHELIAWMIAMYFVDALDEAIQQDISSTTTIRQLQQPPPPAFFGEPLETPPDNDRAVTELLYGHYVPNNNNNGDGPHRALKHLSCRTNFLPATDQERVLPTIVVTGLAKDAEADIMQVRSDDSYKSGWVLDVSSVERDTKVKVENCGGLGYIDMKIALYGIPESGPLQLWLPLEATKLHESHDHSVDDGDASHWFHEIIVCEANEKRPANACQLDRDVTFTVGGVAVAHPTMIRGAAEYLKRPTCIHVGVPSGARITRRGDLAAHDGTAATITAPNTGTGSIANWPKDHIGLTVEISAMAPVTRENGACCISHVVWEQH